MTLETEACELVKCSSQNCQLSDWEEWSACTDDVARMKFFCITTHALSRRGAYLVYQPTIIKTALVVPPAR